jgi:putative phosphotransacetylase
MSVTYYKGTSPYCQECGACASGAGCGNSSAGSSCSSSAGSSCSSSGNNLVDIIAEEVTRTIRAEAGLPVRAASGSTIPLGVSNRHLHVTRRTFEELFGFGTEFEVYRDLLQPGEFASKHTVTLVGPKMRPVQNVRILGALRDYDQVEVSLTDAVNLGIKPPIGDLANGAPLTIVGPKGSIYREHIAVIANRHVHMSDVDAARFGVREGDFCKVRVPGEKGVVFENVLVRTDPTWKLILHLDTDDANAAHVRCNTQVEFYGKM